MINNNLNNEFSREKKNWLLLFFSKLRWEIYIKKSYHIFAFFGRHLSVFDWKIVFIFIITAFKLYLWPHLWPGVPLCLQTELLDLEDTLEARRSFGELLRETCKNSAKAGFLSTSSLVTCLAIMILLSPHWTHGTTSCLGSPISSNVFFRLSKAFLKAKICRYTY